MMFKAVTDEDYARRIVAALGAVRPTVRLAYQMLTKDSGGMLKACSDAGREPVSEMLDELVLCIDLLKGVTADLDVCHARLLLCAEEMAGSRGSDGAQG